MLLLYTANLIFIFAYGAYFLLPVHLRELGATNAQIGAITAATGITNTIALVWLLISGFKSEPRRLMLLGIAAFGVGCAGMALSENLWVISAMRMFHGAGFCLYFIAANTWVSHNAPEEVLAKHLGYLGVVTLLAQSVSPPLAEAFARGFGFPALFAATLAFILLSGIFIRLLPETTEAVNPKPASLMDSKNQGIGPLLLGALALLGGGLFGAVITFSPLHLMDCHIVPVSLFFIAYAVAAVAVRLVFRDFADSLGHLVTARICFLVLAASVLMMSWSKSALTFGTASAIFGMGHGLMYPSLAAYSVNAVAGGRLRGMAVWAGGFAIGVSLGAWIGGLVAEYFPIPMVFRVGAALPLLAALVIRVPTRGKS